MPRYLSPQSRILQASLAKVCILTKKSACAIHGTQADLKQTA